MRMRVSGVLSQQQVPCEMNINTPTILNSLNTDLSAPSSSAYLIISRCSFDSRSSLASLQNTPTPFDHDTAAFLSGVQHAGKGTQRVRCGV